MQSTLPLDQISVLDPGDAVRLWESAIGLAETTQVDRLSDDELIDVAAGVAAALPPDILRALHRYRSSPRHGEALLLRGLLPPDIDWGPNPDGSAAPLHGVHAQAAALCLLAVAVQLGEPFTFRTFCGGRLVQHVVPVPGMAHTQTSESSEGSLDWHVEDGFSRDRCDYFALLCLRGDSNARTMFAAARNVTLPAHIRAVLGERSRFQMWPDSAHVLEERTGTPTVVLGGPAHDPALCFDAHYLKPTDPDDTEATRALAALEAELDAKRVEHVLVPGDLLLLDNRRAAHARSPFSPANDGGDRWLLRTMICSSLPRFRSYGQRVI